ncbi:hypothetical protein SAMN06269250_1618 [Spirosoma fluviale]|uniref:Uncharacterized protein n=2 Tax=Spirosoma fluviale TaxID=1597977 RepID=A0A286FD84_9BACT|nr:hypothetical protein SAMN06269250_1618 [Spirosoma fluviale]
MHFIESYNAEYIYDLEKALARRLKDFAYLTTKDFTGRTECYKFDSISVFMEALIVVTNK